MLISVMFRLPPLLVGDISQGVENFSLNTSRFLVQLNFLF